MNVNSAQGEMKGRKGRGEGGEKGGRGEGRMGRREDGEKGGWGEGRKGRREEGEKERGGRGEGITLARGRGTQPTASPQDSGKEAQHIH